MKNKTKENCYGNYLFAPAAFATLAVNHDVVRSSIYIWGITCFIVLLPVGLYFFNAHDELEKPISLTLPRSLMMEPDLMSGKRLTTAGSIWAFLIPGTASGKWLAAALTL